MQIDPNLMIAALKAQPQDGVIKPTDTGDDNVLPPDPGFMGAAQGPFVEVSGHGQMPFPDNHNPDMDFANRFPTQMPPSGIMNDLKPQSDPVLMRKLLTNGR